MPLAFQLAALRASGNFCSCWHISTSSPNSPVYIGSRGWQSYTHPEGKRYYSRDLAPRIIVEVDLMDDAASAATDAWADLILGWAAELDLNFGPSVELFVDPEVDMGICDYYFVDHATRAVFWLEDAKTSELGMLPACSDQHMSTWCSCSNFTFRVEAERTRTCAARELLETC